jgi:hypothetical protein
MNPVNAATRGITVAKLKEAKEWFNGPEFLKHSDDLWPEQPPEPGRDLENILPETITGLKKTRHGNINDLLFIVARGSVFSQRRQQEMTMRIPKYRIS